MGASQPGNGRAAAEAGGVGEPAGQLPGCRGAAAALADGEGAHDERAGTPLHRPEHAECTEAAGPGELGAVRMSPRWVRDKEGGCRFHWVRWEISGLLFQVHQTPLTADCCEELEMGAVLELNSLHWIDSSVNHLAPPGEQNCFKQDLC